MCNVCMLYYWKIPLKTFETLGKKKKTFQTYLDEDDTSLFNLNKILESTDYLFITCRHFNQLWTLIRSWLDISLVDTAGTHDHYYQFGQLGGFPRQAHPFLKTFGSHVLGGYRKKETIGY